MGRGGAVHSASQHQACWLMAAGSAGEQELRAAPAVSTALFAPAPPCSWDCAKRHMLEWSWVDAWLAKATGKARCGGAESGWAESGGREALAWLLRMPRSQRCRKRIGVWPLQPTAPLLCIHIPSQQVCGSGHVRLNGGRA